MQTNFSLARLADPNLRESNAILRACVHCGFCLATCPTHVLLGDELDSPRGRIYLIKEMLENDARPSAEVVKHIDRCLTCLSCMTTCPSGVDYGHLIEHGRAHVGHTFRRPPGDRFLRWLLAWVLPHPGLFRAALRLARPLRPLSALLPQRLRAMVSLAPTRIPPRSPADRPRTFAAEGQRRWRVALLAGCVQRTLAPRINAATVRLLTRLGAEVVVAAGAGCCGALVQHLGLLPAARAAARANLAAWGREIDGEGLDAIVINASGCGATVKDYAHLLRGEAAWASTAKRASDLARDISEFLSEIGNPTPRVPTGASVAYQPSCALLHGQGVDRQPKTLLSEAGFILREVPEAHLCCGSAGVYNLLQPDLAGRLRERKRAHIEKLDCDFVATGNVGCIVQLAGAVSKPVVHTVELLDWAAGGPPISS